MKEQELRKQARALRRQLADMQRAMENPDGREEDLAAVDELREEMEAVRRALGMAWVPTKTEEKQLDFQRSMGALVRVDFATCHFAGGWREITVELTEDGAVRRENSWDGESVQDVDREEFLGRMQALHMEEWRRQYNMERFGFVVTDGEQWTLKLSFDDGRKPVRFRGDNDFPYNFARLLEALGVNEEDEEMLDVEELLEEFDQEADGVYQVEGVYFAISKGKIFEISDDASCAPKGGWFPNLVRGLSEEQEAYLDELGLDEEFLPEFWEEWEEPTLEDVLEYFDEDDDAEKIQLCRELDKHLQAGEGPFADVPSLLLALPRRGLERDVLYYPWEGDYIDLRENILDVGEERGALDNLDDEEWRDILEHLEEYRVVVGDPGVRHEVDFVVTVCLGRGDGGDEMVTLDVSDLEYEWMKQCCRMELDELSECEALEDLCHRLAVEVSPWDEEEEDLYQIMVGVPDEILELMD